MGTDYAHGHLYVRLVRYDGRRSPLITITVKSLSETPPPEEPPETVPPPPPSPKTVVGQIEGFSGNHLTGWVGATNHPDLIAFHIYLGGPAGQGDNFGEYVTDQPNEAAVSQACQVGHTSGRRFRFDLLAGPAVRAQHQGKTVFIHGIHPDGGDNLLIGNSGAFSVPPLWPGIDIERQVQPDLGGRDRGIALVLQGSPALESPALRGTPLRGPARARLPLKTKREQGNPQRHVLQ